MLEAVRAHNPIPSGDALIETIRRFRNNPEEQLSIPSSVSLKAAQEDAQQSAEPRSSISSSRKRMTCWEMESATGRWDAGREDAAPRLTCFACCTPSRAGHAWRGRPATGNMAHDLGSA